MKQHIYFGPVSEDVADEFETFEVEFETFEVGGVNYDFHMEVNVEDQFVRISDAIGRMIPVDITQIESMLGALRLAKDLMEAPDVKAFVVNKDGDIGYVEGE